MDPHDWARLIAAGGLILVALVGIGGMAFIEIYQVIHECAP